MAPEDDELEKALKLAQVDMYTKGLVEREKRKRWERERRVVVWHVSACTRDSSGILEVRLKLLCPLYTHSLLPVALSFSQCCQTTWAHCRETEIEWYVL